MKRLLFGTILLALVFILPVTALAEVNVNVNISLPPPIVFAGPPEMELRKALETLQQEMTERKLAGSQREAALEEIRKLNENLEQRIKEGTAELVKSLDEYKKLNLVFVDRELKMIELKKRIAEFEKSCS
jgi:hypothetical protein